jgi:hypothetical protein
MKKIILPLLLSFISFVSFAQPAANDSAVLGGGYRNDVFYNVQTGSKVTVPGNNWHIAFAVRNAKPPMEVMQSTTILVNEARNTELYKSTQTNWASFDSTGYKSWNRPHNSDTSWNIGAFNADYVASNAFNYGWGNYSQQTHHVEGTGHIYLLRLTKSVNNVLVDSVVKKIKINRLLFDTQWVFTIANLDGSDSNTVTINKKDFTGKLFAYYNMVSKTVVDREPSNWDLLFTRYAAFITQFGQTIFSNTTGVLQHPNTDVAEVRGVLEDSAKVKGVTYSKMINTIGTDWKINPGPGQPTFVMEDSLTYFVRLTNNKQYRLNFRSLSGSSTGIISFYKGNEIDFVGLFERNANTPSIKLYPNPANQFVEVSVGTTTTSISIFDITGKLKIQVLGNGNVSIDISSLKPGIYFVQAEGYKTSRLVVE